MRESICQFGPSNSLTGILTKPEPGREVPDAPTAIILNAGIVHRVGPFRLHVDVARKLAECGFSTLRMDLSGLGDSRTRRGKVETDERSVLDVGDAMTYLQMEHDANNFVLLGLCSGAFNAHQVAVKDDRIVGAVFMDGIVFRTFGFFIRHYIFRLFKPRFWRNAIKRRWLGEQVQGDEAGNALAESEFFSTDLDKDVVIKELEQMLDRGAQLLFLYTNGYDDICGREQFREMYGFRPNDGQLQVEYYPETEHTFRLSENRAIACERVANWYQQRFSAASLV